MNCVKCGEDMQVKDSRKIQNGTAVWRRRRCPNGHSITTYELDTSADRMVNVKVSLSEVERACRAMLDSNLPYATVKGVIKLRYSTLQRALRRNRRESRHVKEKSI